ncbi:MAG: peptidoglycan DD-metalloendopeptidase family protein [Leptolyngbyaceae cyanobacterium CSU_1_4]|nr:peptidoglycan DD-metalloendopeptidase family protein [Leptolyngbyaceae cyanobacterium CSU_1_4]
MTQRPDSKRISHRFFSQRALLASGLSCLSGMSFFGSAGMVVAQTSPSPEMPVVPSAHDLLDSAPPTPIPAVAPPSIAIEPQPSPPPEAELEPAAIAPAAPAAQPVEPSSPEPVSAETPLVSHDLAEKAKALGSNYIDSTPYDVGATPYQPPSAIVLSDRSSGCQAVVNKGDIAPGSICEQLQNSSIAQSSAQAVAQSAGGSNYSGGYNSVSLGSVSLSSYGLGLSGRTTPSGKDYYNLTSRPPAKLGNGNIGMMFPLSIPAVITSAFGWRIHPIFGESRFHPGTDIGADQGTPVLAAFAGKVEIADFMGGYGLAVVLRHNKDTEETLYAHLSELFVKPGEMVKQGEVIGRVGSTGNSTGPHLHFEFRQHSSDGSWVTLDPGQALEFSLAKFVTNLQLAQAKKPLVAQVVDPLQRLKVVLQEAKQAQLAKKNVQAIGNVLPTIQSK